jgi:hypothetical protein
VDALEALERERLDVEPSREGAIEDVGRVLCVTVKDLLDDCIYRYRVNEGTVSSDADDNVSVCGASSIIDPPENV